MTPDEWKAFREGLVKAKGRDLFGYVALMWADCVGVFGPEEAFAKQQDARAKAEREATMASSKAREAARKAGVK